MGKLYVATAALQSAAVRPFSRSGFAGLFHVKCASTFPRFGLSSFWAIGYSMCVIGVAGSHLLHAVACVSWRRLTVGTLAPHGVHRPKWIFAGVAERGAMARHFHHFRFYVKRFSKNLQIRKTASAFLVSCQFADSNCREII